MIRLHIPLVASDAVVNRGLDILEEVLMVGGAAA